MRIISFNVNGIRSVNTKDKAGTKGAAPATNLLRTLIAEQAPDVLCLQEIKTGESAEADLAPYKDLMPWITTNTPKAKKGYSGVAILSRTAPLAVHADFWDTGLNAAGLDEGRILTAEFDTVFVVTVYTINSKDGLTRLPDRLAWDAAFREYIHHLQGIKSVVVCGDLNCAHEEIDIHNPKGHRRSPGFSDEERASFGRLLAECALRDSFRRMRPAEAKYTYWSNMGQARKRNAGWRIDYILVGAGLAIGGADCLVEYGGSDHCPVVADVGIGV